MIRGDSAHNIRRKKRERARAWRSKRAREIPCFLSKILYQNYLLLYVNALYITPNRLYTPTLSHSPTHTYTKTRTRWCVTHFRVDSIILSMPDSILCWAATLCVGQKWRINKKIQIPSLSYLLYIDTYTDKHTHAHKQATQGTTRKSSRNWWCLKCVSFTHNRPYLHSVLAFAHLEGVWPPHECTYR